MDAPVGLTFRDPSILWTLFAAPLVLLVLISRERLRRESSSNFVSERIRGISNRIRTIRPWLLVCALVLLVVALAGPRWGFRQEQVPVSGFGRILVLDVSESMSATDVGSSRLQAARAVLDSVLDDPPERIALMLFEGETMILSPLTSDAEGVRTLLESVRAAETPRAGSDIGQALLAALDIAADASPNPSDIVIVSDGEHQGADAAGAIARAAEMGIRVHTILIGSARGAPIPTEDGVLSDDSGKTVLTRADGEMLSGISEATGGIFLDNPFVGSSVVTRLATDETGMKTGTATITIPFERFQLPLAISIILFLFAGVVNRGAE